MCPLLAKELGDLDQDPILCVHNLTGVCVEYLTYWPGHVTISVTTCRQVLLFYQGHSSYVNYKLSLLEKSTSNLKIALFSIFAVVCIKVTAWISCFKFIDIHLNNFVWINIKSHTALHPIPHNIT